MARITYTNSLDSDEYLEAIERFKAWCDGRDLNFRHEMRRMIEAKVGQIDQPVREAPKTLEAMNAAERKREYGKAYYQANKAQIAQYNREYQRKRRATNQGGSHA